MRIELQPGFVLHRRPYRNTSLLLEVITAEHGRLSLVARGVRTASRRGNRGALLQPFVPLLISFSGKSELKTMTAVESAGLAVALSGERMFSAMYLNELLVRLLHRHDPHPLLFARYADSLEQLGSGQAVAGLLRRFELCLLDDLGYGFSLTHDAHTGAAIDGSARYRYMPGQGLYPHSVAEDGESASYPGLQLLALAAGNFDGPAAPVARQLLREALSEHLGEEPLRSRELFQRRPAPAAPDALRGNGATRRQG